MKKIKSRSLIRPIFYLFVSALVVALLISQLSFALPSDWSSRPVVKLKLQEILVGPLAQDVAMQQPITREEFAEIAVRLYLHTTNSVLESLPQTHDFLDTTNPYVGAAYRLGIVKGVGATKFDPKAVVDREQIATMLFRELTILNLSTAVKPGTPFADAKAISSWAKDGVDFSRDQGLVQGVGQNRFAPQEKATREQVYKIVESILSKYGFGIAEHVAFSNNVNGYLVPKSSDSQLIISEKKQQGIALRIQSGIVPADRSALNMPKQWLEVYDILRSKWGYLAASRAVLDMQNQWQTTNLNYGTPREVYILSSGAIQNTKPIQKPYLHLNYRSVLTLEIIQ